MNKDVIRRLGQFRPPATASHTHSTRSSGSFGNTVALRTGSGGVGGGLFALCEDGCIRHMRLDERVSERVSEGVEEGEEEGASEGVVRTLRLRGESEDSLLDAQFSALHFNFSGSILLLSGASEVGVVFLPAETAAVSECESEGEGEGAACRRLTLYRSQLHDDAVVKVLWHPLSDRHVVVLLRTNKLLMFDVVEGTESEYLLDASKSYTSFCFGPAVDWMSLSVFLLDNDADVTCMCPLLPTGAVVPTSTILELQDWLSDLATESPGHSYLKRVDSYLRAAFGGSSLDEEGDSMGTGKLRRAGIFRGQPLGEDHVLHEYFYRQPLLQGPLMVEGRLKKRNRGSSAVPCDICAPMLEGEPDAPVVFLVSWSDGVIEQFVLGSSFGPNWNSAVSLCDDDSDAGEESLCFGSASLVHVETLSLTEGGGVSDNFYTLQCDPLNAASFHVTAQHSGECFLVNLNWITDNCMGQQHDSLPESSARLIFHHPLSGRSICGQVLVSDPLYGHVVILRCDDGYMAAVNLRVEQKMMQLDADTQFKDRQLLAPSAGQGTNVVSSISRSTDTILATLSAALKKVPMPDYNDNEASTAKYGEALKKCITYLGREVVDPMEEFEFGLKFAKESLSEILASQQEILHGPPERDMSNSGSSVALARDVSGNVGGGLLGQYEEALRKHDTLKCKLDSLGERIQLQKAAAAGSLHYSKQLHVGLTRAEELYKVQVDRWVTAAQHLAVSLDRLKEQVECSSIGDMAAKPVVEGSSPRKSTTGSQSRLRNKPSYLTPTKARSSLVHVSSPHRISYRNSPRSGNSCRVISSTGGSRNVPVLRDILLDDDEKDSCDQLQRETGILHEALQLKVKNIEERMSRLANAI